MEKGAIIKISLATLISLFVFLFVVFTVDPAQANSFQFGAFYLSLFVFLFGVFFVAEFYFKKMIKKTDDNTYYQSFLHGFLFSSLVLGMLMLQHFGYFTFLNIFILFVFIVLLELTFSKS